jgi:hypothetical protein
MPKIESMLSDGLSEFDRLIPEGGICVYPEVWYFDVNDIPIKERISSKRFFREDPDYRRLYDHRNLIFKGEKTGRRFCAYIYRDLEAVGNIVFTEVIDNPHGFGKNDFSYHKWIFPKYRKTKYSRYAISDLIHMLFISGIARRIYVYTLARKDSEGHPLWERIDFSLPCASIIYDSDGPETQKYIFLKQEFQTPWATYLLLEFNGDIYRSMDLKKYFMAAPGRDEKIVERWLKEMNEAADEVGRVMNG